MKRTHLFFLATIAALLVTLMVATTTLASTPIIGGNSFSTAVVVSPGIEYSGTVSSTHTADYFYFDVAPGQIATVAVSSTATWTGTSTFTLYDQAHVSSLRYKSVSGADQSTQWVYVGNSTTPTRYYLKVSWVSGNGKYLFQFSLANQTDGGVTGDAGDDAASARVLTPAPNSVTSYSGNRLGNADTIDWFRINSASGQTISITVTMQDWGGTNAVTLELDDEGGVKKDYDTINKPGMTSEVLSWVSNNTSPAAYLLKVLSTSVTDSPVVYKIDVQMGQQSDGGATGDAGDNFDSARTISLTSSAPTLNATGNLLAGSDTDDYFMIKLPQPGPYQSPDPAQFGLVVNSWPSTSSFIRLYVYDAQRNPINSMGKTIYTPSTTMFSEDMTNCGSDGCYFRVNSGYTGNLPVTYTVKVTRNVFIYLPLIKR